MLGLQSRDKTHILVLSPQGLEDFGSKGSDSVGLYVQPIPPHSGMKTGCEGGKAYCKGKTANRKCAIINMEAFTVRDSW